MIMTSDASIATDNEFRESVIERVEESADYYQIYHDDAMVIGCPKVEGLPAPRVGETLRTYGKGFGYSVRGITVGGRVYRYLTADQEEARQEQWCRDEEAKREREFEAGRAATDARIEALPEVFRARIYKFQRDGGHKFRRDYESYELFCCEQAVAIADALKTRAAVNEWRALPFEQQRAAVERLSDGHSGNTFGAACALALLYIEQPEFVSRMHGALTPLVGCADYGCRH